MFFIQIKLVQLSKSNKIRKQKAKKTQENTISENLHTNATNYTLYDFLGVLFY